MKLGLFFVVFFFVSLWATSRYDIVVDVLWGFFGVLSGVCFFVILFCAGYLISTSNKEEEDGSQDSLRQ